MENKNEIKKKVKKVLWRMVQIPTIICVLAISGFICYYAKVFYRTNTLVFGIQDTKMLLGISVAAIWSTWFCIGLMLQMNKKNNIIIEKNDVIISQNESIKDLINQVKNQNDSLIEKSSNIEEATEELKEAMDFSIENSEDHYDQLVKFHKNNRLLFMERNDDIA